MELDNRLKLEAYVKEMSILQEGFCIISSDSFRKLKKRSKLWHNSF